MRRTTRRTLRFCDRLLGLVISRTVSPTCAWPLSGIGDGDPRVFVDICDLCPDLGIHLGGDRPAHPEVVEGGQEAIGPEPRIGPHAHRAPGPGPSHTPDRLPGRNGPHPAAMLLHADGHRPPPPYRLGTPTEGDNPTLWCNRKPHPVWSCPTPHRSSSPNQRSPHHWRDRHPPATPGPAPRSPPSPDWRT